MTDDTSPERRHPSSARFGLAQGGIIHPAGDPDDLVDVGPARDQAYHFDPLLPAVPAAKAAALEQAVMLVGLAARGRVASQTERVSEDLAQLGGVTLAIAGEFEAYLTGEAAATGPHAFVSGQPATTSQYARCLLVTGQQSICGKRRDDPVHKEA
jgi:hypothetical protein